MVAQRGASTWSSSLIALTRREPNVTGLYARVCHDEVYTPRAQKD